jgi:spore coat protein H
MKLTPPLVSLLLAACGPRVIVYPPGDSSPSGDDTAPPPATESCSPEVSIEDPYGLEGQPVSFTLGCASGLHPGGFEASLTNPPRGARFDAGSWTFEWTPGLDQGGRYDLMLAVLPRGADSGFPETTVVTLWVADAFGEPGNDDPDPMIYTEEWGLPVFHLDPEQYVGQEHVPADVTVYGHTYHAEMKIRGAASASYPKPSYTIRFSDEDFDASPWDMGNKDHLYAITAFDDNSYVRQKLCYDLWQAMADHFGVERLSPRTFFGVVFVGGEYHGVYTFSDRPDDHFLGEMGLSREANLYKSVSHYANFYRTFNGSPKSTLHDGYEKKEGEPPEGEPGAWDDLEALVAWSADASHEVFWAEHQGWLRIDEFMDWLIFVQWTAADDSAGKNAYLYNDPEDFEFRYCPWDFNHSYGQGWYTYRVSSSTFSDYRDTNGIFDHLQGHPEANEQLWDRYRSLRDDGPLNAAWMRERIDAYYGLIHPAAQRDWERWGRSYANSWGSHNPNDYDQERAYLETWITERDAFIRSMHP